ncbi:hypothetical protein JCM6882_002760 [Rhodosporidiobolus microsporus]
MSLGPCCVSGFIHEGTPTGKVVELNGVKTYVALPSGDYDKTKALLYLTDIFGIDLPNGLLLADSFAKNGLPVYMPDMPNGDPVEKAALQSGKTTLPEWFSRHGRDVTRPPINKVIAALKEQGVKEFAAIGYCWGARYVVDLILDDEVKVGVVAHASLIEVPKDIEALDKKPVPFLWIMALQDYLLTPELQKQVKELLKDNKYHSFSDFDAAHGFSNRGDPNDPKIRAEADRAFEESLAFIKKHL